VDNFIDRYIKHMSEIRTYLKKIDFGVCKNMSTELIKYSNFVDYPDGIFIAEFLESIFNNLDHVYGRYKIDKKEIENIVEKIETLIIKFQKFLQNPKETNMTELYNMMRDVRVIVTKTQLKYYTVGKRIPLSLEDIRRIE